MSEMIRRNKVIKWIKKEIEKTELLLSAIPDSNIAQARADILADLCRELDIPLEILDQEVQLTK